MAIALVQNTPLTPQGAAWANEESQDLAFGADVTAGNLLTCTGSSWPGNDLVSITSTRSDAFTIIEPPGPYAERTWIAYAIATSSGPCTVTVTAGNTGSYGEFNISEWSGVNALDVDGGFNTNNTDVEPTPSIDLTTEAADTLVIAVMSHFDFNSYAMTPGSGWTQLGEYESGGNTSDYNAMYQIFDTAGLKTADWSLGAIETSSWGAQAVSFKFVAFEAYLSAPAFGFTPNAVSRFNAFLVQATAASFVMTAQAMNWLQDTVMQLSAAVMNFTARDVGYTEGGTDYYEFVFLKPITRAFRRLWHRLNGPGTPY